MEQEITEFWDQITEKLPTEKRETAARLMQEMADYMLENQHEWKYDFANAAFAIIWKVVQQYGGFELDPEEMYRMYCAAYENSSDSDREADACIAAARGIIETSVKQSEE